MSQIFISHSSKDSDIVKSFVNNILCLGMDINREDIFCTSIQDVGIRSGEDFLKRIKAELINVSTIYLLISDEYRKSEICLNEMGAAWALEKKVIPLILPPLNYSEVGCLHSSNHIRQINNKGDLISLCEEYSGNLSLSKVNGQIDIFLEGLTLREKVKLENEKQNQVSFDFFNQFLNPNANVNKLLLSAQPTLLDCQNTFSERYAKEFYFTYSFIYLSMIHQYIQGTSSFEQFEYSSGEKSQPGGVVDMIKEGIIENPNELYSIDFKKGEEELGTSFNFWKFINSRWVFFPKPHGLIDKIRDIVENKSGVKYEKTMSKLINSEDPLDFFLIQARVSEKILIRKITEEKLSR